MKTKGPLTLGVCQCPLGDVLNTKRPIAWIHLLRKTMTSPFLNRVSPSNHTPYTSDHPAVFVCYSINTPAPCLQGGEFDLTHLSWVSCKETLSLLQTSAFQYSLLRLGQNEPGSVTETMARNDRDLNAGSGGQMQNGGWT